MGVILMRCWKYGRECAESFPCAFCGSELKRTKPVRTAGEALVSLLIKGFKKTTKRITILKKR